MKTIIIFKLNQLEERKQQLLNEEPKLDKDDVEYYLMKNEFIKINHQIEVLKEVLEMGADA